MLRATREGLQRCASAASARVGQRERDRHRVGLAPGTRYDLYLELPPHHALFCISARRDRGSSHALYRLSLDKSDFGTASPNYLGKLQAADLGGLSWTLYSPGQSPRKSSRQQRPSSSSRTRRSSSERSTAASEADSETTADDSSGATELRAELMCLTFEHSILGSGGPIQLCAAVPTEAEEGARPVFRPQAKEESLLERLRADRLGGLAAMTNKEPTWNDQLQSYTLEYNGRATEPSVKNIQLVEQQKSTDIKFQLGAVASRGHVGRAWGCWLRRVPRRAGKVGSDRFNVDYKRPYSALQAFAIAVAVFDDKLFCSPAPPILRSALSFRDRLFRSSS